MGSDEEWREFLAVPANSHGIMAWLQEHPKEDFWKKDNWQERCRTNLVQCSAALVQLTRVGVWVAERWGQALQVWSSDDDLVIRSWQHIARRITRAPAELVLKIAHSLSWWLRTAAVKVGPTDPRVVALVHRVLDVYRMEQCRYDSIVSEAINHPVGHAVEAALRWWYRRGIEDGQGIPEDVKILLDEVVERNGECYRLGRVILGTHIITLFRVDPLWASSRFIHFFNWDASDAEAHAVWSGFLVSPRLFRPFIEQVKDDLLKTVAHYDRLGEWGERFASLLTFAAFEMSDTFPEYRLREAFSGMPANGLESTLDTVSRTLESAGSEKEEFWRNRARPFLMRVWPQSLEIRSPRISNKFAKLIILTGDAFPYALNDFGFWLGEATDLSFIAHLLRESGLCEKFPYEALTLLDYVSNRYSGWSFDDLRGCLDLIGESGETLREDSRYRKLIDMCRRSEP
jgi:hypothetical protein